MSALLSGSYHSHSDPYSDWLIFHWLGQKFRWWSIAIYAGGAAVIGAVKAIAGIGKDTA